MAFDVVLGMKMSPYMVKCHPTWGGGCKGHALVYLAV